jgi:hypothetical protein
MVRIALYWIIPTMGVEAEEQLDVLGVVSARKGVCIQGSTYASRICQGAPNIAEEEVSKLYGIQTRPEQTVLDE